MRSMVDESEPRAQHGARASKPGAGLRRSASESEVPPSAPATKLAHDVRNALAGVRAVVQIVRDRLPEAGESALLGQAMARLDEVDSTLQRVLASAKTDTCWVYSI